MLRGLLEARYDAETAARIWVSAETHHAALRERYKDAPKGETRHLYGSILPRMAMYRALCERLPQSESMALLDETVRISGTKVGTALRRITSLPGMHAVFMLLFSKMVKDMFGSKNGFAQTFYEDSSRLLRFDITRCPYCRCCQENGCPELTHTFCDSDVYCYGGMSKIRFERTETLGTGGDRCDFTLTRLS